MKKNTLEEIKSKFFEFNMLSIALKKITFQEIEFDVLLYFKKEIRVKMKGPGITMDSELKLMTKDKLELINNAF